ncbi:9737_t:CDS:2, partial [Gigaspora margarita]
EDKDPEFITSGHSNENKLVVMKLVNNNSSSKHIIKENIKVSLTNIDENNRFVGQIDSSDCEKKLVIKSQLMKIVKIIKIFKNKRIVNKFEGLDKKSTRNN